jgi:hypothetical protein
MALTIEIDGKGVIANADVFTNDTGGDGTGDWDWVGSGGVAHGLTTDTFYNGSASASAALSGAKSGWLYFNMGATTAMDFTGGGTEEGQHIYIWVHCPTIGLSATVASPGVAIQVGSSTTAYRTFTVAGTDDSNGWDGAWKCFVVDPTKTGSVTDTGTPDLSAIQYIGAYMETTATAKGDNLFIGQIAIGRGLTITGTSTTGWQEVIDYTTDRPNRAWGMLQEREGIFYAYGTIKIGETGRTGTHTAGTSTTVMTDSAANFSIDELVGKTIYNITDVSSGVVTANTATTVTVSSLTGGTDNDWDTSDAYEISSQTVDVDFSDSGRIIQFGVSEYYISSAWSTSADIGYSGIVIEDRTADWSTQYKTTFTDGVVVGTDKGRSGSTIIGTANHDVALDLYGGNATASLTELYGTTLKDITGAINSGNDADHKFYSVAFIGCEQFDPVGAPVIRNCTFAETVSTTGALLWNSNIDIQTCAFIANTIGEGIEHDTIIGVIANTCSSTGSSTTLNSTGNLGSVTVGQYAYNETDGTFAQVTSIAGAPNSITTAALPSGTWTSGDAFSISSTVAYTELTFSGNTSDVTNSATGSDALFIATDAISDPTTETGTVEYISSVTVQVTVKDTNGVAISGAQVGVYTTADDTQVMNEATLGSGIASEAWTGGAVEVKLYIRKGSSADTPKYKNHSSIQNITGSGLTLDVALQEDPNNNSTT